MNENGKDSGSRFQNLYSEQNPSWVKMNLEYYHRRIHEPRGTRARSCRVATADEIVTISGRNWLITATNKDKWMFLEEAFTESINHINF